MLTKEQRAAKKAQKHEESMNAFKVAFESALQKKLGQMPQMFCGVDMIDELNERRADLFEASKILEGEEVRRGFMLGVENTLDLVFRLCETVPGKWREV